MSHAGIDGAAYKEKLYELGKPSGTYFYANYVPIYKASYADGIYCPYVPLCSNNYIPGSDTWHRPDRQDCQSLYHHDGRYWTPDEYHANYDDKGDRKTPAEDPHYTQACEDDPSGKTCGRCSGENRFYDDVGWFAVTIEDGSYVPVCKACWDACGGSTVER